MCAVAEFPTSAAELGVVFSLFDSHKLGRIYYKEFVDTVMRPDRQVLACFHPTQRTQRIERN